MIRHINIAIITPSPIVFSGLTSILSRLEGMNVTFHHAEVADIARLMDSHKVSLIIIDVLAGHIDDVEHIHASNDDNSTSFVLFSSVRVPQAMTRLFDASIGLYDTEEEIRRDITSVLQSIRNDETQAELTQREKQIVVGVVNGLSNKEIAAEMNVSINTVMTHRRNIASKLHIHSAAGLTIYAIAAKLIDIDRLTPQ